MKLVIEGVPINDEVWQFSESISIAYLCDLHTSLKHRIDGEMIVVTLIQMQDGLQLKIRIYQTL